MVGIYLNSSQEGVMSAGDKEKRWKQEPVTQESNLAQYMSGPLAVAVDAILFLMSVAVNVSKLCRDQYESFCTAQRMAALAQKQNYESMGLWNFWGAFTEAVAGLVGFAATGFAALKARNMNSEPIQMAQRQQRGVQNFKDVFTNNNIRISSRGKRSSWRARMRNMKADLMKQKRFIGEGNEVAGPEDEQIIAMRNMGPCERAQYGQHLATMEEKAQRRLDKAVSNKSTQLNSHLNIVSTVSHAFNVLGSGCASFFRKNAACEQGEEALAGSAHQLAQSGSGSSLEMSDQNMNTGIKTVEEIREISQLSQFPA